MAGLPRKYAKMGFKKGWAAYRKKKGASKTRKKSSSPAKKGNRMVRRRRSIRRAARRFVKARSKTIPVVDIIHGVYTLDGLTNGAASKVVDDGVGLLTGTTGTNKLENDLKAGVNYMTSKPKDAVLGGAKNFAIVYLVRKAASFVLPSSVKLFGKYRIQVR